MAGVAFSLFGEEDASTKNSYPMATAYATSATPKSDQTRIIRASGADDIGGGAGQRGQSRGIGGGGDATAARPGGDVARARDGEWHVGAHAQGRGAP